MRQRVHLLLFCTEGEPFDHGKNTLLSAKTLIDAAQSHFDSIRVHTPRSLLAADPSWEDYVSDVTEKIESDERYSSELPWNREWARVGFFRWKPKLILHELLSDDTRPGDIIFYHDPDVSKYPEYFKGVRSWSNWLRSRMANLDVLAFDDNGARISSDVKPELIEQFLAGEKLSSLRHIWAGAIAVRKNEEGISFARAWKQGSQFEAVGPFTATPPPPGFVWNSCDQAVLTALWHSQGHLAESIRREVQPLYRSRAIPPPGKWQRFAKKKLADFKRRGTKKSPR